MRPSKMSVTAAVTKRISAVRNIPRNDAIRKTGIRSSRRRVRRLGMVARSRGLAVTQCLKPRDVETAQPRDPASKLGAELVERALSKVDRLSFRKQQILPHQIVNEARHRLARCTDHVGDRLMRRPRDGDVSI